MENKEERNIVDLNNENIKKYSFVLTDEINGQKYKEINYIEKAPSQNKCIIHEVTGEEKNARTDFIRII